MTARSILEAAFAGTAVGDGRAFVEMLGADVQWTIIGSTDWSRTYVGKRAVLDELLRPLSAQFAGPNIVTAERFIGDGNIIVVEGQNHSKTVRGEDYANRYCWIFTFQHEKVINIVEYCDTALVERALRYPRSQATFEP